METTTTTTSSFVSSSSLLEEGSEPSHPPLNQQDLCASFMEAGNLLFSAHPELFSNALEQLSNQLSLAVAKTPGILRSRAGSFDEEQPLAAIDDSCSSPEDEVAVGEKPKSKSGRKGKHKIFRKYALPKNAPPEYYQCMDCGEKRSENSFMTDHMHFGRLPKVRWFCPLCEAFFSVTHRSGHIKCKHSREPITISSEEEEKVTKISRRRSRTDLNAHPDAVVIPPCCEDKKEEKGMIENSATVSPPYEEEEKCVIPAKKRACEEPDGNSSTLSPTFTSSPIDDFLNNPRTTTTATSFSFSTSSATSSSEVAEEEEKELSLFCDQPNSYGSFCEEDLLPAFRCPSYVIKPYESFDDCQTPSNEFLF